MKAADETQRVTTSLWHWQAYDPAVKTDLSSHAVVAGGRLYFIDPITLAEESLEELAACGRPAGVILTSANHERASAAYCKRFGVPLFARGDEIEGLAVVEILGGADGEIALHSAADGGVLVVGDALINVEPYGFAFLPDKYCGDAAQMRENLRKLLEFEFSVMAFAHGLPIASKAGERLQALLSTPP